MKGVRAAAAREVGARGSLMHEADISCGAENRKVASEEVLFLVKLASAGGSTSLFQQIKTFKRLFLFL